MASDRIGRTVRIEFTKIGQCHRWLEASLAAGMDSLTVSRATPSGHLFYLRCADKAVSHSSAADDFPKQILPVASFAAIDGFLYPRHVGSQNNATYTSILFAFHPFN